MLLTSTVVIRVSAVLSGLLEAELTVRVKSSRGTEGGVSGPDCTDFDRSIVMSVVAKEGSREVIKMCLAEIGSDIIEAIGV